MQLSTLEFYLLKPICRLEFNSLKLGFRQKICTKNERSIHFQLQYAAALPNVMLQQEEKWGGRTPAKGGQALPAAYPHLKFF